VRADLEVCGANKCRQHDRRFDSCERSADADAWAGAKGQETKAGGLRTSAGSEPGRIEAMGIVPITLVAMNGVDLNDPDRPSRDGHSVEHNIFCYVTHETRAFRRATTST
jgi:hypothetical protein